MAQLEQQEFQQRIGRIETLIQSIESIADPAAQETARELVQALLELHGAGIERMLGITFETGAAGQVIIDNLARDDLVSSLLLLHGLHPLDLTTRVLGALDKVRPTLAAHGGDVELLGVSDDGVVGLRLEGSCRGCPSSQATLKYSVEEAIYAAAPDVKAIEVEGAAPPPSTALPGFVPMSQIIVGNKPVHLNGAGG
jgi:Fe-S cluster biogenesis protein NfuA